MSILSRYFPVLYKHVNAGDGSLLRAHRQSPLQLKVSHQQHHKHDSKQRQKAKEQHKIGQRSPSSNDHVRRPSVDICALVAAFSRQPFGQVGWNQRFY